MSDLTYWQQFGEIGIHLNESVCSYCTFTVSCCCCITDLSQYCKGTQPTTMIHSVAVQLQSFAFKTFCNNWTATIHTFCNTVNAIIIHTFCNIYTRTFHTLHNNYLTSCNTYITAVHTPSRNRCTEKL